MLPLLLQASKRANEGAEDGKHTGHHMSEIGKRTATQNANPEKDKWNLKIMHNCAFRGTTGQNLWAKRCIAAIL